MFKEVIIKLRNYFLLTEVVIIVLVFFTVSIYFVLGLELRDPWSLYLQRIGSVIYMYFFMLPLVFFLLRLKDIERWRALQEKICWKTTWVRFRKDFFNLRNILFDLRLLNAIAVLFVLIINLRHIVPYVNKTAYDNYLIALEEWAFNGKILSFWIIEFIGANNAPMMSDIYRLFYPYLSIIIFTFVLYRDALLSQQFFLSFIGIWMIGIVITCLWPTWGPCFYSPQYFTILPETTMTQMQQGLWEMKQYLELNPQSSKAAYLISALPSLHVAVIALGSIYLFKVSKILSMFSWGFVVVTIISTLYFGWHYFVDDVIAIIIAYLAYFLVNQMFKKETT